MEYCPLLLQGCTMLWESVPLCVWLLLTIIGIYYNLFNGFYHLVKPQMGKERKEEQKQT